VIDVDDDTHTQLLALRDRLDEVVADPTAPADLSALVQVADGVTEVLLREIARARQAPTDEIRKS
jgi:hypothetical protein